MQLNTLLNLYQINPSDVAVILSQPKPEELRVELISNTKGAVSLNRTFASHQPERASKTLSRRKYALLFVPTRSGQYLLTGFFHVNGSETRDADYFDNDDSFRRLKGFSKYDIAEACRESDSDATVVALNPVEPLQEFVGRLIISVVKKKGEMAFMRLAENLDAAVFSIREENWQAEPAPNWDEFIAMTPTIRSLPPAWEARLKEWRGIYLIVDEDDGKRYVGSAYGTENILGRWRMHVAGEKGITKELAKRDPINFRFSILQLLAPDEDKNEVIKIENRWMERLHTRRFGLNHGST